jgi:predicted glycosyltransferase
VLIVDHVPRGTENELELALTRNRSGLRVLGLRGILFDREKTARHYFGPEASRWIADHFDAILVYIDPAIHALEDSYEVPAALKERIHYTGYLAEPSASSRAEARQTLGVEPGQRLVVASMGGGQGALPIWTRVIEALRDNVQRFDRAYVVTGPYLEAADLAALREVATREPWLTVAAYEARLGTWMAAADLVIGAAGSNMLGEILATRCNAIAVPRQVREPEQQMHATRLAERGLIRTRDLDAVLDHGLTDVVAEALTEPLEPNQAVMLGGARRYASHVAQLWSQR